MSKISRDHCIWLILSWPDFWVSRLFFGQVSNTDMSGNFFAKLHQTFTDFMYNQYTNFDIMTCQMWLKLWNILWFYCVFSVFLPMHNWRQFMSGLLNLHQTFTDQYTHFDMLLCQMWPHDMEGSLVWLIIGNFSVWFIISSSNFHKSCRKLIDRIYTCHPADYIRACYESV